MNDPVRHDPTWPPVPTKLPSDIPKFEGKTGEDLGDRVTTFHLWCSSNSLNDDSIHLRLFQRTLMRLAVKWYIELPRGTYRNFNQMILVFLNHFQLSVRYDADIELLLALRRDKATNISDHIQKWHKRKRLIKAYIPPEFLLEWFLKSLLPYISKDVSTSEVTSEEEAIFKAHQLDLIYAQSGMLYEILPDAPRSNYDPRQKLEPHVDGIIGSTNVKSTDLMTSQLKELSLSQSVGGQALSVSSTPTQSADMHFVQSSTNPNGNQQLGGNKKKGCGNNRKAGRNNNNNKPKHNINNDRSNNNVGEGKKEKRKVKFPCKLCIDDHLTHLCPKLEEAARFLSLLPALLTNPFPHNQHMASSSFNVENATSGNQNPPVHEGDRLCVNMVKSQINVATRSRDYSCSQAIQGLESPPPLETPLQIKKPEPLPRIPKGVLKRYTHNPNARAAQNYFIVEDMDQTPCAMSALEVLQRCPSQKNALLSTLGALDPCGSNVIKFDITDVKPHLPYHVAFQIHVDYSKYTIKHIVIDEGVATCVMFLTCSKAIGSPTLSQSLTMLTAFDGRSFRPHCILPTFPVQLGGKTVEVDVEVVDAPLDYNLLLGCNWT
jgi:hypothetical protein